MLLKKEATIYRADGKNLKGKGDLALSEHTLVGAGFRGEGVEAILFCPIYNYTKLCAN